MNTDNDKQNTTIDELIDQSKPQTAAKSGFEVQSFNAFASQYKTSDVVITPEMLESYKQKIFSHRPSYAHMMAEYGSLSFFDVSKKYTMENRNKTLKTRRPELIETTREFVRTILGSNIADSVARQLKDNQSVSTLQHHGPLAHPDVLNNTLVNSLPYFDGKRPEMRNIIVFSCSNISFNNYTYPKGNLFNSFTNDSFSTHQLPLFGHTADARPVLFHAPYDISAIESTKDKVKELTRDGSLEKSVADQIMNIYDEIFASPHILSADSYAEQITIMNESVWRRMFRNYKGFVPNLVFISQEEIVLRLISAFHLKQETTISRMIFHPNSGKLLPKYFEGIMGSFSLKEREGTYLFWALPADQKYRVSLWKEGEYLISSDGSYKIHLDPDSIANAIEKRELMPSLLLVFSVLSFYYGLFLGGGRNQIMYLPQLMEAYKGMQTELGDTESVDACARTATNIFVYTQTALAFIETHGKRLPATAIDLLLYGEGGKNWSRILSATKNVTLDEMANRLLPNCYLRYCPPEEKDDALSQITERDIEIFTGLDKKIPPFATI